MNTCYATDAIEIPNYPLTILSRSEKKQKTRKGQKKVSHYPDKKGILAGKTAECMKWLISLQRGEEVAYDTLMKEAKKVVELKLNYNYHIQKNRLNKHRKENFRRGMTAKDILEGTIRANKIKMEFTTRINSKKEIKINISNKKIPSYDIFDVARLLIALEEAISLDKISYFLDVPDVLHVLWCIQQLGIRYYYDQMKLITKKH